MRFRELSSKELETLERGFSEYGAKIELPGKLMLSFNGRREVVLLSEEAFKLLKRLGEAYSAGLKLGEIKRKKFKLDLEGAFLISRHARNVVVVNSRGEELALYGRDIFINSVLKYPELKKGERCLIVNTKKEALAIGRFRGESVFVENIKDRGWYLRKGG